MISHTFCLTFTAHVTNGHRVGMWRKSYTCPARADGLQVQSFLGREVTQYVYVPVWYLIRRLMVCTSFVPFALTMLTITNCVLQSVLPTGSTKGLPRVIMSM